jgi:hypothetical protein
VSLKQAADLSTSAAIKQEKGEKEHESIKSK